MKCDHCGKDFPEDKIQEHHIHPRFMDNLEGLGMKAYLCEKCHIILHLTIPKIIWNYLELDYKSNCISSVKKFTFDYCKIGDPNDSKNPTK